MEISHEVPLSMLEMSRWFNDYDYALVHLFDKYPDYFDFYKKSIEIGRTVILDNSLYELGSAFDMAKYASWINKLNPTYYILPDTFWNTDATMNQAMEWMYKYGNNISCKRMGVAQGDSLSDIIRCYKFMSTFCDRIAFTFKFAPGVINDPAFEKFLHDMFLQSEVDNLNDTDKQAVCRYWLLMTLEQFGIVDKTKEHHLLGLQNTKGLNAIVHDFPWVTSIDTSNPIITGFLGKKYGPFGNAGTSKPETKLESIFEDSFDDHDISNIKYNVRVFRNIVDPIELEDNITIENK